MAVEVGKNSMVQVTVGTIVCLLVFTWKTSNYVRDIKDDIKEGNRQNNSQTEKVRADIDGLSSELEDVSKLSAQNTKNISDISKSIEAISVSAEAATKAATEATKIAADIVTQKINQ